MPQAPGKPLLVRAFELARTGWFPTNRHLKVVLKKEGYSNRDIEANFAGKGLRQQFKTMREPSKISMQG